MWYGLIILVMAGHIYQRTIEPKMGLELFSTRANCEEELNTYKALTPKKGVKVVTMECREASPALNYHSGGDE